MGYNPKLYISYVENRAIETIFKHTNVDDDTSGNDWITDCQRMPVPLANYMMTDKS